jgi:hypothetical protein
LGYVDILIEGATVVEHRKYVRTRIGQDISWQYLNFSFFDFKEKQFSFNITDIPLLYM